MVYGRTQLVTILKKIDDEASLVLENADKKFPIVIVGGSAFLLHDLTKRPTTHDVDVLSCHEALREIISNYRALNRTVSAYMNQIPYNFEDRLIRVDVETITVDFLTPSLEDLAVMKLYGWRPNDQEDLESAPFLSRLDWNLLDKLVYDPDEARASALSQRRYDEMVAIYDNYAKRHGHEPHA